MGGPMDVWEVDKHPWLDAEKKAIRKWLLETQRPFLGVAGGCTWGDSMWRKATTSIGVVGQTLTAPSAS
jgi:hypothetical protein